MPPEGQRWSVPASLFEQGSRARYPELSHDASPGPSSMVLGSAGEDQETEVSIAKRGLHALFRDGTRHWLRTFVHAPGTRPTCEITGARHSVALLGSSDADFVFDPVSKIAHPHFLHLDTENLSRDALIEARAVEFCAPGQGTFEQPEGRTDIVKCVDVRWGDVDSEDERWLGAARDEVGVPQGSRLETDTPGSYTPMRVADTSGTGTPALEPVETGEHTDDESVGPILVDPGVPFGDQYTPTLGDGTRILPEPVIYQSDEDCTRLVIYRPDED
ncbi:hypothetical protein IAR55_000435 [Kwoniella newhampshirensis]|uniref:Uncharacterized protein n=1 Tax=Kwoniella newhampshirensis TaxID=1651941 RepID=A0AAW0Z6N8_9TREE